MSSRMLNIVKTSKASYSSKWLWMGYSGSSAKGGFFNEQIKTSAASGSGVSGWTSVDRA